MKKQPRKTEKKEEMSEKESLDENVDASEEEQKETSLSELEDLKQKINFLEEELKKSEDLYLRLNAEFENFRKRTSKEKLSICDKAKSDCVFCFLEVLDNLERALNLVKNQDEFSEGISLVVDNFYEALKKIGVVEIESLGKVFNPNYHQAIKIVEDEKYDKNIICEVFKKGFLLNDIVIRHAFVVVANP